MCPTKKKIVRDVKMREKSKEGVDDVLREKDKGHDENMMLHTFLHPDLGISAARRRRLKLLSVCLLTRLHSTHPPTPL